MNKLGGRAPDMTQRIVAGIDVGRSDPASRKLWRFKLEKKSEKMINSLLMQH